MPAHDISGFDPGGPVPFPILDIANAYSEWASTYDSDRNLTRDLDGEVTRSILGSGPLASIVEAGCGTGKNTAYFAQVAGTIHALDFSVGMLEVARRNIAASNVAFQQADLSSPWPCAAHCADLVSFNLVLEHIQDIPSVLREAARVVRPGGHVFISELHPCKQLQGSKPRFQNAVGDESTVAAFTHNVSEFLAAAELSGLQLVRLQEWWHAQDQRHGVPRLLTLLLRSGLDDGANRQPAR